jgi:Ca2+-binding RTX toxin-like protein
MRFSLTIKLFALGSLALIVSSIISAFAAGISIPASNIEKQSITVTAEDIKPAACAGLSLTDTISGSGTLTGTPANELIIGSALADTIDGAGGNDCILGGSGDDTITGNDGIDVCLGGPGTDGFVTCETEAQ